MFNPLTDMGKENAAKTACYKVAKRTLAINELTSKGFQCKEEILPLTKPSGSPVLEI